LHSSTNCGCRKLRALAGRRLFGEPKLCSPLPQRCPVTHENGRVRPHSAHYMRWPGRAPRPPPSQHMPPRNTSAANAARRGRATRARTGHRMQEPAVLLPARSGHCPTARLGFQSASVCVREHEWQEGNALARVVALPPAARFPPGSFLEYFQVRDVRSAATCCCRSRCQLARGAQCAHVRTPHARAARSRARARVDGALAERVHHCRMQVRPGCTPRVRDHRAAAALANPKQAADRYAN
jgi:hypothetical protein